MRKQATWIPSIAMAIGMILYLTSSASSQTGFSGYSAPKQNGVVPPGATGNAAPTANPAAGVSAPVNPVNPSAAPVPQSQVQGGYIASPVPNQPGAVPAPAPAANTLLPPPFELNENDQFRMNEFLAHWEKFGKDIKRVSCSVHVREYDGGVFNKDSKIPMSHTWGQFRFLAPNKLLYHVKGEFTYIAKPGEAPSPEWKPSSNESKIVYDGRSLTQYDFRKKFATVYPLPKEEWDRDLSIDGPFPLFFIANAEKLKKRFYMRIITPEDKVKTDVWIEAFPRYSADAQEFKSIILLLHLSDLQPYHLRRMRTNGKSYSDLEFQDVTINKGFWNIESSIDPGWKKTEEKPISLNQRPEQSPGTPAPTSGIIPPQQAQPPVAPK